jgi:hypothetical protein
LKVAILNFVKDDQLFQYDDFSIGGYISEVACSDKSVFAAVADIAAGYIKASPARLTPVLHDWLLQMAPPVRRGFLYNEFFEWLNSPAFWDALNFDGMNGPSFIEKFWVEPSEATIEQLAVESAQFLPLFGEFFRRSCHPAPAIARCFALAASEHIGAPVTAQMNHTQRWVVDREEPDVAVTD